MIAVFDRNCCLSELSRKRYEIGPSLLRITNRKSQVADRSVSVPVISSNFERHDTDVKFFRGFSQLRSYRLT